LRAAALLFLMHPWRRRGRQGTWRRSPSSPTRRWCSHREYQSLRAKYLLPKQNHWHPLAWSKEFPRREAGSWWAILC